MLVTLISSSGQSFTVKKEYIYTQSQNVNDILEGAESEDEHSITIPNAPDLAIEIIVQYINTHKTTQTQPMKFPLKSKLIENNVSSDDLVIIKEINKHDNLAPQVLNAANFLHIQGLIDLCTKLYACAIMCTPVEKMDELFADEEKPSQEQLKQFNKLVRPPTGILFE